MILCYPITNQRTDKKNEKRVKGYSDLERLTVGGIGWEKERQRQWTVSRKCGKEAVEGGWAVVCMPPTIYTIKSHFCPSFFFLFFFLFHLFSTYAILLGKIMIFFFLQNYFFLSVLPLNNSFDWYLIIWKCIYHLLRVKKIWVLRLLEITQFHNI